LKRTGESSHDAGVSRAQAAADLYRLIDGYKITQAIHVAAVLGLADHLAAGPRPPSDLATATGTDASALHRLLRALAAIGVVTEHDDGRFSLTAMGETLRADVDHTVHPFAVMTGRDYYWRAWGALLHSVRTGENAFTAVHGVDSWTYRNAHPEDDAIFNAAMMANARRVDPVLAASLDIGDATTIADIGGGRGSLLMTLLTAHRHVRGVLVDRPSVVAEAAPLLAAAGLDARCDVVAGDMLESVPSGCDLYLLKFVIHDWDDASAVRILGACRQAMTPTARIIVLERLIGLPNERLAAKLSDLNMLVGPGGRERTRDEFAALFDAAGLRLTDVRSTPADLDVIVGERT
jgi:hypothetical protein